MKHKEDWQETPYFFWRISTSKLNKIELMRPLCAPRPRRSFSTRGHHLWPPRAASTCCHCALLLRGATAHCFYVRPLRIASTCFHCELLLRATTALCFYVRPLRTASTCCHCALLLRAATAQCALLLRAATAQCALLLRAATHTVTICGYHEGNY